MLLINCLKNKYLHQTLFICRLTVELKFRILLMNKLIFKGTIQLKKHQKFDQN